jgi:SAM-dependent methyltransferase
VSMLVTASSARRADRTVITASRAPWWIAQHHEAVERLSPPVMLLFELKSICLKLRRAKASTLLRRAWWELNGRGWHSRKIARAFDIRYCTNTAGVIQLADLKITSENRDKGNQYQPMEPDIFGELMRHLLPHISLGKFTFVDFGSGKGRALFLAAEYPFKHIIGVEFSSALHAVAQRNIMSYRNSSQRCHDIQSVLADASIYDLPLEPLVLFFFNPFSSDVMRNVLAKLTRSLRTQPRPAFLIVIGGELQITTAAAGLRQVTASVDRGEFNCAIFSALAEVSTGDTHEL